MAYSSGRDGIFPNLTIESLSVFDVLAFCEAKDYAGLTAYLAKGFQNLAAAGAQYGALTGITPHIVYDELSKASPIPIISMVDTACSHALSKGYDRVGLLGTLPTMNGSFFQSFSDHGVTVVTPMRRKKRIWG